MLLISAGSTRGKTYLCKKIIKDLKKKHKYTKIFIISDYPEEWEDIDEKYINKDNMSDTYIISKDDNILG